MTTKELRQLMESRIVEVEFPTSEVLIYHAAASITASKEKQWAIIRKRFSPIAMKIDTKTITKANQNQPLKLPMSEADILYLHGINAFLDQRCTFPRFINKWVTPVAMKILEERKEYH